MRQELIADYLQALRGYMDIDEKHFFRQLRHFVLFRTLQVLGAYGFRGYFEKKPHFIQSVPFAIDNLRQLLKEDYPEYPYLCTVLRELTNLSQFYDDIQKHTLKVKIVSFAYKKEFPTIRVAMAADLSLTAAPSITLVNTNVTIILPDWTNR